eukprot:4884262-Ditylum_brightwellii.AAC.1
MDMWGQMRWTPILIPDAWHYELTKDVKIGASTTFWMNPNNGAQCILEIHQALMFMGVMDYSLINPHQLRHYGV